MSLAFEAEKYQWVCECGKRGRFLIFGKACKASDRHISEHERKYEWDFSTQLVKESVNA
jgi:hypothetical protein